MQKVIPSISLAVLLAAGCIGSASVFAEVPSAKKPLVEALQQQINFATVENIYNRALLNDGSIEATVKQLKTLAGNQKQSKGARSKALHTLSLIQWREGQMDDALKSVEQGLKLMANADLTLQKAKLLDATGQFDDALVWYKKAIPMLVGSDLEQIQVRITLMEAQGNVEPLVKLAKSKGNGFRNRAAVALAIMGHESEAIDLYRVDADAKQSERFRQCIRLADWSIRADNPARAQQEAWEAVHLAKLKRDRRYALSLLVEAHRMNDSIDALIAKMGNQRTLTEDERSVWVELLRETKQYDRAIAAFKETSEDWTSGLKRQLIGLYKEASNDAAMEKEFTALIESEPGEVSWPQGLSEHYLEKGRRPDAIRVWQGFIGRNERKQDLLLGAAAMVQLGLDDLATAAAKKVQKDPKGYSDGGFLLFELYLSRGRLDEAEQELLAIEKELPATSLERRDLADGFERIQQPENALKMLQGLYDNGVELGVDGEMRIAWLQQSLGQNEEALKSWYAMLEKTPDSQRRLVEDRILLLSAELGRLGRMAVSLEEKILNKTADEKDARMLIKIYSKAGDAGSAIEIIEEFFGEESFSGDSASENKNSENIATLREKGTIFQFLGDYKAYNKVTRQLLAADAEHRIEHVRSLILNHIENVEVNRVEGGEKELQTLIEQHTQWSDGESAREFEAGVLELSGDMEQAANIYRIALAENPERGDNYLVMANLMSELGQVDEAVRMFQYIAERAERDDLFVIAMDGLLNMQSGDVNVMKWAQRVTLERLTSKSDKAYLYSLLSDLADDGGDVDMQLASLENSLSHANSRRAVTLRELIVLTDPATGRFGNKAKKPDIVENLKYSRRLIALREEFPPEVFINMGKTFLSADEPENAMKAFNMAVDSTGRPELMTDAAAQFEQKNYDRLALTQYEKSLIANSGDLRIMWRLGELKERAGWNDAANKLYGEGLQGILSRHPIQVKETEASSKVLVNSALDIPADVRQDPTKTDEYKRNFFPLRDGFVRTLSAEPAERKQQLGWYRELFNSELEKVDKAGQDAYDKLIHYPRLSVTSQFLRFAALSNGYYKLADEVDLALLKRFGSDEALQKSIIATRNEWGQVDYDAVIAGYSLPEETRAALQNNWDKLAEMEIKPLFTVKQGKSRSVWGAGSNSDSKARLDLLFNLALLADDQDRLLDVCRDMVKEGMFSTAISKGQGSLDDSHFKRLCSYTAQRVSGSKKEFERALVSGGGRGGMFFFPGQGQSNKSWLDIVEEQTGEAVFDESELLKLVKGVTELERLNAAYVMKHMTGRNRITFLKMIAPTFESSGYGRSSLGTVLGPQLAQPISQQEQAVWLEVIGQYGRAYDGMEGMGAAQFLQSAEITPENSDFVLQVAKLVKPKSKDDTDKVTQLDIKLLATAGKYQQAIEAVIDLYLADGYLPDYLNMGGRRMAGTNMNMFIGDFVHRNYENLLKGRQSQVMAALQKAERNGGDTGKLLSLRVVMLGVYLKNNPVRLTAELEALAARYPDNTYVLENLSRQYQSRGFTHKMIVVLQQLVKVAPYNLDYQAQLQAAWQQQDHPVNALIARNQLAKTNNPMAQRMAAMRNFRQPGADQLQQIAEARDSGNEQQLRSVARKLWQQVAATEGKIEWSFDGMSALDMGSFINMKWPAEQGEEEGIVDPMQMVMVAMSMAQSEDDDRPTVIEKLADYPFSVAEFETWITAMRADQIDNAWPIYQALAKAALQHGGAAARAKALSKDIASGRAGDKEVALWLALLEADAGLVDGAALKLLKGKVSEVGVLRKSQLIALAHIYARAGAMNDAVNCYSSVANAVLVVSAESGFGFGRNSKPMTAVSLLKDAAEELDKSNYYRFLNGVLKLVQPPVGKNLEQAYAAFVLAVLKQELDSPDLRQRFGALLERNVVVDNQWQLASAVDAAYIQVRMGNPDQAVDSLREGMTPVSQVVQDKMATLFGRDNSAGYRQMLGVASNRGSRTRMGMIGIMEAASVVESDEELPSVFEKLFPAVSDGWNGADRWVDRVAGQLQGWLVDSELDINQVLELAGVVMEQLSAAGNREKAQQVSDATARVLDSDSNFSDTAASRLMASADKAGVPIDLAVAQELLKQGRLKIDQTVVVLRRTLRDQGAARALALGKPVTEYSLNDKLLTVLQDAAKQAGQSTATFEQLQKEAEDARQQLAEAEKEMTLTRR